MSASDQGPKPKRWTKGNLQRRDWDFRELCRQLEAARESLADREWEILIGRATVWEIERELGSGHPPFDVRAEFAHWPAVPGNDHLTLQREKHPPIRVFLPASAVTSDYLLSPQRKDTPLDTWPLGDLAQYLAPDTYSAAHGRCTIHAFKIPRGEDEAVLVKRFRLWLHSRRGGKPQLRKAGRPKDWRSWFTNVAIYRLAAAGLTRKEAVERVRKSGLLENGKLTAPNFARAKRTYCERIASQKQSLVGYARAARKHYPELRREWWQCFLKPRSDCQK